MKKLLLVLLLGFSIGLFLNARTSMPPYPKLKICTLQNIYYVDGLSVYDVANGDRTLFKDGKEMYRYILNKTKEDNKPGYECLTKKNNYLADY